MYIYMYVCITASFCYTEEKKKKTLSNIVDQLYFNLKKKDKVID